MEKVELTLSWLIWLLNVRLKRDDYKPTFRWHSYDCESLVDVCKLKVRWLWVAYEMTVRQLRDEWNDCTIILK